MELACVDKFYLLSYLVTVLRLRYAGLERNHYYVNISK